MMTGRFTALLLLLSLIAACKPTPPSGGAASSGTSGKPSVYVVNYPLKYFAERIGGDLIDVHFPAPADEDPAFWTPSDEVVSALQQASVILMNGATYSKWADKVTLPTAKVVDTSASFASSYIVTKSDVTHSHGPGGDHSHSGTAFTTWIDFTQAISQAKAVHGALVKLLPGSATGLDANLAKLSEELRVLDERLKTVGQRMKGEPVVASHPVYQYFARRYEINLQAVLWEPETVPDEKAMADLKAILAKHAAKWMIWEGDPAAESVAKLQAIGVQSLVFSPSGNVPEKGDFISVMQANVAALEKAFP